MTDHPADLISAYLDDALSLDEEAQLYAWINESPANARAFAGAAMLHDRLSGLHRDLSELRPCPRSVQTRTPFRPIRLSRIATVSALAASVLLVVWLFLPSRVSAQGEIDRLISVSEAGDRVYRIVALGPFLAKPDERQPPIDGAILSVRRPDKYVLVRKFADGRRFVTGSDGQSSFAIPPDGAVRVDADPMRFRGPLPGHHQGIPFADLRSDLVQLRDAYLLKVLKPQSNGWQGLLAEKKSPEYRGARRVELWYDGRTGVIHRMVFEGLPQARGGPDSVSVELLEQRDLGASFFQHASHHTPDRRVIEEQ